MAKTLQELSDRAEIQELMVNYCYAIDTRDWAALDDVFTEDAMIDYSEVAGVRGQLPEIKIFLAEALGPMLGFQHTISTSQLRFEGDRAFGRTACFNPMIVSDNGERRVVFFGLWYRDTFERTPNGWRISERYEEALYNHNAPPGLIPDNITAPPQ